MRLVYVFKTFERDVPGAEPRWGGLFGIERQTETVGGWYLEARLPDQGGEDVLGKIKSRHKQIKIRTVESKMTGWPKEYSEAAKPTTGIYRDDNFSDALRYFYPRGW